MKRISDLSKSVSLVLASIAALIPFAAQAGPGKPVLVLWDCDDAARAKGLAVEHQNKKGGKGAVRWKNHPETTSFAVPNIPKDWTGYHLLRMWVHNAKPVPTRFMIIASSENPETKGLDYWGYGVSLDFVGWKELILPIGGKDGTRSPRGWDQIDALRFVASGWGNTPHPDADVLIDHIRLEYDPPRPGPRMSDQAFFQNLDLSLPALGELRTAVESGDLDKAKKAFLAYMRFRTEPGWWFDWRDRPHRPEIPSGGSDGWDYYVTRIKIDWTGWKQISLPLKKWGKARKPIGWNYINGLRFSTTYGDRTPNPKTTLILDGVQLAGDKILSLGSFETSVDFKRWRGLKPTKSHVREGEQAGLWSRLPTNPGLGVDDIPRDWRQFAELRMWVHSAEATGDVITLIANSDPPAFSAAENVLEHIYGGHHLGEDIDWESNKYDPEDPAFTREWTYGLNRFRHWQTLGRAYWESGDEKYAREWIAQVRDWVEDNPYLLFGTGNKTLTWRTIEAGIRCSGSWPDALYYFLGAPSLQPDDLVVFMKSWIEHAHHLMRITVEHPKHGGNWVTMECNGLGHLGILFPECKDAKTWLKTATDRLTLELDRQVYPDGAQKELTTGYHQVARRNFVDLFKLARHNGRKMPKEYLERLERMYVYNLQAMTPDGCLPPLNDAGYTRVLSSLSEGAELFDRKDFRWAATGEGKSPAYTSVAFPYAGQYVMRSGWGRDDLYMLFESGPFGIGHQHEDKLSMFIYGMGRVLLTEAGTYSYDQSKYRRYVLGTWGHNTILVDGQQQRRRGLRETYETDQPLENLWVSTDRFDVADGVYDNGYGPKRDKSVSHERAVVFVKPAYWVVVDWLHTRGEHRYDILWHLNNDQAEQDAKSLTAWGADIGKANLMVTPLMKDGLSLEIVNGRDEPVLGFAPAKRKKAIPVLNYQFRAKGPACLAWVLTPFREKRPNVIASIAKDGLGLKLTLTDRGKTDTIRLLPRNSGKTPSERIRVETR